MKIWTEICIEPSGQSINGKTIVIYLSEEKLSFNAKTRGGVTKALLRLNKQVFGACAPVNKRVIQIIKALEGKEMSAETLESLRKRNKKYTPFRYSRDYQLIIQWLDLELKGNMLRDTTFRKIVRAQTNSF